MVYLNIISTTRSGTKRRRHVSKPQKAIFITLAGFALFLLFWHASSNFFCCLTYRPVTCERLYWREVMTIDKALDKYMMADKPFPTLDEMVADGSYTLPQDRKIVEDGYPIDPRDLSVKLFRKNHSPVAYAYKVIISSTKGKCKKGNTLVVSRSQDPGIIWFDRQSAH